MVLKVHGFPIFAATQVVIVVLKELGVPYEFVIVNYKDGEHKSPEYLEKMHPFGQIPVLVRSLSSRLEPIFLSDLLTELA